VNLRVIGAGFGRTGTLSLKVALEELGFGPCEHMTELLDDPERLRLWDRKARGLPVEWGELFKGYAATVDWPGCYFWEELAEAYPKAKVILTVRDREEWYESVSGTIHGPRKSAYAYLTFSLAGAVSTRARRAARLVENVIWEGTFGGRFAEREHAIRVFDRHVEEVKKRIPADRLLVYEAKESWGPLCKFLGVEVPEDKPFPYLNKAADFRKTVRSRYALPFGVLAVGVLAAGLTTSIALLRLRRR
jgi:hypothetical protein